MIMHITGSKTLNEAQEEFNRAYPFLKIEFYTKNRLGPGRIHLKNSLTMSAAGLKQSGDLKIDDSMTVGQLEKKFFEQFGLYVQVSRCSGNLWLETTMTDNWTLKQQNDHGRELSETPAINFIIKSDEPDYD